MAFVATIPEEQPPPPTNLPPEMIAPQQEERKPTLLEDMEDLQNTRKTPSPDAIEVPAPAFGNKMAQLRIQHPQYADMNDIELGDALYNKHYADIPKEQFEEKVYGTPLGRIGQAVIHAVTNMIEEGWNDIKTFMDTGDERAAFRLAATLATGGMFKAESGAVGAFGGKGRYTPIESASKGKHLSPENKEWIKTFNEEGHSPAEIADILTRYYTPKGVEITEEQVKTQMKRMDIKSVPQKTAQKIQQDMSEELTRLDQPIFGKHPTQQEIIHGMQKKFPDLSDTAIINRLDRHRRSERMKAMDEEKFGRDFKKRTLNEETKASETISKPEGQMEFDFGVPKSGGSAATPSGEVHYRLNSLTEAKLDLQKAQDVFAKAKQTDKVSEETRTLGLIYERKKALYDTLQHIAKESKNDLPGLPPIREILKGRLEFFRDEIKRLTPMVETKAQQQQSKAVGPAKDWKTSVEEPAFRKLMGQEYAKAKAGDDYSTMYDILGARLYRDKDMPKQMRETMELEMEHIKHVLGPEWLEKYGGK